MCVFVCVSVYACKCVRRCVLSVVFECVWFVVCCMCCMVHAVCVCTVCGMCVQVCVNRYVLCVWFVWVYLGVYGVCVYFCVCMCLRAAYH